jgi:outer membrane lipoprotein-sorting protein
VRNALCILVLLVSCPAGAENLDPLLGRLADEGKKTRTLEAPFIQRKRLALFRTEVVTKGRVYYRKPNFLRWETIPPDASVLLVSGQRGEFRLPGEKPRVLDLKQGGGPSVLIEQLFIWLGARPAKELLRYYQVKSEQAGGLLRLYLTPLQGPLLKRVSLMVLELNTDLSLRRIEVKQRDGDSTTIEFTSVRRNAALPENIFR